MSTEIHPVDDAESRVEVDSSAFHEQGHGIYLAVDWSGGHGAAWLSASEADALIAGIDAALDREPVPLRDELLAFTSWLHKVSGLAPMDSTVDAYLEYLDGAPAAPVAEELPASEPVPADELVKGARYRVLPGFRSGTGDAWWCEDLTAGDVVALVATDTDRDGDVTVMPADGKGAGDWEFVLPEYLAPIDTEETP